MFSAFADRVDAGRRLADLLRDYAGSGPLLILGLPRGGVVVAAEVARLLKAELDVFVVRKIGVPGHEELAMGAVASGGVRVMNPEVIRSLGITRASFDQVTAAEQRELERRERLYREGRPFPSLRWRTVVLVDDGVATGSTMLAALQAVRRLDPARLVVAAPVMSVEARAQLAREADRCVTLAAPEPFGGVGAWYQDFRQTTDAEVIALLHAARVPAVSEHPHVAHR